MIKRWVTALFIAALFLVTFIEELEMWWAEWRHHRRCLKNG